MLLYHPRDGIKLVVWNQFRPGVRLTCVSNPGSAIYFLYSRRATPSKLPGMGFLNPRVVCVHTHTHTHTHTPSPPPTSGLLKLSRLKWNIFLLRESDEALRTLASVNAVGEETFRKSNFPEFPIKCGATLARPPPLGARKNRNTLAPGSKPGESQLWRDSRKVTPAALSSVK